MEYLVEDGLLVINPKSGTKLDYVKLKTQIINILGSAVREELGCIKIPTSSISLINDLLPADIPNLQPEIEKFDLHAGARIEALRKLDDDDVGQLPTDWREILDPGQATAVAAMTTTGLLGLCLFDEQGSGKTVMTIAAFDILRKQDVVDALLVICPKSMMREWPKEISKFIKEDLKVVISDGSRPQKFESSFKDFDVLIANYESTDCLKLGVSATAHQKRLLLVADESYFVKNVASYRSKATTELRAYCDTCFVLCGTPAPNSPYDLVNQFNLADLGYTFVGFNKTNSLENDRLVIEQKLETRGVVIRRLKDQILDAVPEKNFHLCKVPLTGRQELLYEKARSELELKLRTLTNASFRKELVSYFQRRSVLLQLCTVPSSIDPLFKDTPVKYLYLDNLLTDILSKDRKVIVWSYYKNSIEEMLQRYQSYHPLRLDGSVKEAKDREKTIDRFQNDDTAKLLIANPAAAGSGITLHAASDAIYVSYPNQAAHYLQSLDRIHRRGQKSSEVNYYLIFCEGTIEETEVKRLRTKEVQQHSILGDHIPWPSSLDVALAELTGGDNS